MQQPSSAQPQPTKPAKPHEDAESRQMTHRIMYDRESFSLVCITGDASEHMEALMDGLGYVGLRGTRVQCSFEDASAFLLDTPLDQPELVRKGWFRTPTHTVLMDPEMVVGVNVEVWTQLAQMVEGTVVVALWERVSHSVLVAEIGPEGLRRRTSRVEAKPTVSEEVRPHELLIENPNDVGVCALLASMGIQLDNFGERLDVTVYELRSR